MGRAIASLRTADVCLVVVFLPPKNQFFLAGSLVYYPLSIPPIVYFEIDQTFVKYTFL